MPAMPASTRLRRQIFVLAATLLGALVAAPEALAASQPPSGGAARSL